jgi:hypothetical protein
MVPEFYRIPQLVGPGAADLVLKANHRQRDITRKSDQCLTPVALLERRTLRG